MEDGAEEFFLKPVKLADMKKLKSHLVRRKQPQPQEKAHLLPLPQQQKPEPVSQQQKPEQAPQQPAEEAAVAEVVAVTVSECSKKRKAAAMEQEVLSSPGRTNPRVASSGLAVET